MEEQLIKILSLIGEFGGVDGAHHKQWLLDQIVREIAGDEETYCEWVTEWNDGEEGAKTYEWDVGVSP